MKSGKLLISLALMALVLGAMTATTHAVSPGPDTDPPPNVPEVSTGTAPGRTPAGAGIRSVGSSTVSGVSPNMLPPGPPFDLCFTVVVESPDAEFMDGFDVQLPTNWTVNTVYDVPGTGCGYGHTYGVTANKLWWYTNGRPTHCGDWSYGTYNFCANVTVPDCNGSPWSLGWNIIGDIYGSPPHSASGSISADCMPPGVYLTPEEVTAKGCSGVPQVHTFDLHNNTGAAGNFDITYSVPTANGSLTGPSVVHAADGATVSFSVTLTPNWCLSSGDLVTGQIEAAGNDYSDQSTINKTIIDKYWIDEPASPVPTMDHAAITYDGKLYVVMGQGSDGAVQIYDPLSGWSQGTPNPNSYNDYSNDGCLGLDAAGNPVIDILGDTTTFLNIQRYDINADTWTTLPYPAGYPPTGLWAYDVVSMLQHTGENVCYISGGATGPGGGNTNALYRYDPAAQTMTYLGNYTHHPAGFDFHFAWWVPWVQGGSICVAGGADINGVAIADSQCYYLAAGSFGAPNADLGALPEPWWGGADGWKIHNGRYQIWGYNGVDASGDRLQASFYMEELLPFGYGPAPLYSVYRVEGDNLLDSVWAANGSTGGFISSKLQEYLFQCEPCRTYEWEKIIDGEPWAPEMQITRQFSDTIEVVEVLHLLPPKPLPPLAGWKPAAPAPPEGGWLPGPAAELAGAPAPQGLAPASAPGVTWKMPSAVLYDNGPLVTHPGVCGGQDASRLQSNLGLEALGFQHNLSSGYHIADDFEITDPAG